MSNRHGSLSINSDNIFPIIKKWLYSDHDIFYRELISNGCDAITKLKKLDMMGEYSLPDDYEAKIRVVLNPEEKTLKFIDNGLGMTADEVEEYINQIAFSGATDFLEKYKDKANEDQIIGHFGLGFYSAFMVADEVHIDTLSYKDGATAVHWECDGGTEFDMTDGSKEGVGTEITLFLNEDCLEFANEYRAREVIEKYCSFMPTPIFLEKENAETEYETIPADEVTEKDTVVENIVEEAKYEEKEQDIGNDDLRELERVVMLKVVDQKWMDHIDAMDELKDGIGLRAYGQQDPVVKYRIEGMDMFEEMVLDIKHDVVKILMNLRKQEDVKREEAAKITGAALQAINSLDNGEQIKSEVNKTVVNEGPKVGRNDPCPCGSGKKYKNCCGKNK